MRKQLYRQKYKDPKSGEIRTCKVWRARISAGKHGAFEDISLGLTNKEAAEKELERIIQEKERELVGDLAPKNLRAAAERPLKGHIEDYIEYLMGQGRCARYVRDSRSRLTAIIEQCNWKYFKDINADSFNTWISKYGCKKAAKTCNHFIGHLKSFIIWMEDCERVSHNPLKRIKKLSTKGREVHPRRALTLEESWKLINIDNQYRGLVYYTAIFTGLRQGELKALMWADFHLEEGQPYISVRAATTKTKEKAIIPLVHQLAKKLLDFKKSRYTTKGVVFYKGVPRATRLKKDLEAIGIPYKDELGLYADFHALRHTCATLLSRANVVKKDASGIMRHRDSRQTDEVYTHTSVQNLFEASNKLAALLPLPSSIPSHENGTEGVNVAQIVHLGQKQDDCKILEFSSSGMASASNVHFFPKTEVERATGLEPATSTLAR